MESKQEVKISRRRLLRSMGLAGAGVAAAGVLGLNEVQTAAAQTTPKPVQTDVLVIGMGVAGLCVANRALDQGAKVTLIDKLPKGYWVPGGSMIVAGQSVHIGGLSLMDTEENIANIIHKNTANRDNPAMTKLFVANAHRGLKWLKSCGVQFEEAEGKELTLKPKKAAVVNTTQWGLIKPGGKNDATKTGGKVQSEVLLARLEKGGATLLFETTAKTLVTNEAGEVAGAMVKTKDGMTQIEAGAVFLCTGGLHFNQEMVARYTGAHASEILPYGTPGATGDGYQMALEVDAMIKHPGIVGGLRPCPEDSIWNPDHLYNNLQSLAFQGILVDEYGDRVFDESTYVEQKMALSNMTKHSENVQGMIVIDDAIYKDKNNQAIRDIIARIEEFGGTVYKADTAQELADMALKDEKLGLRLGRQQNLANTVKAYNDAIDAKTNMDMRPSRKANLNKLATAPLYGIPYTPIAILSFGGLAVNEKTEVLDKDGNVIPGLYAVGEIMHNAWSSGPGNTLGHEVAYTGNLAIGVVWGMLGAEAAVARLDEKAL